MGLVKDALKGFILSLGDPRRPASIVLEELWNRIFPPPDTEEIFLNVLYEAIADEVEARTGNRELPFSKERLRRWMQIDIGEVPLEQDAFSRKMVEALKQAQLPLVEGSPHDYEQIIRNIVKRARIRFIEKLAHRPELFNETVLNISTRYSARLEELWKELNAKMPELGNSFQLIDGRIEVVLDKLDKIYDELRGLKEEVEQMARDEQSLQSLSNHEAHTEEIKSLMDQIKILERRIHILEEQKLRLGTLVPPYIVMELEDDMRTLQRKKKQLEDLLKSNELRR